MRIPTCYTRKMPDPILEIEHLKVHFRLRGGTFFHRTTGVVKAVDDVCLSLSEGEVLGLVGESGCGKSTLARSVVQLVRPTAGAIRFEGRDIAQLPAGVLRKLRPRFQMIFQDPYASLNPRRTVYDTLAEPLVTHAIVPRREVRAEVASLMERVGLASRFVRKYPHEFSGGQRQRIAIARALALRPKLILADEPVSALDVSVQAQILNLLQELTRDMGLTMVLISHDLSVVQHMAQRIAVMYLGKIVEIGPAQQVFHAPRHDYTRMLLEAIPLPDPDREQQRRTRDAPHLLTPPQRKWYHRKLFGV